MVYKSKVNKPQKTPSIPQPRDREQTAKSGDDTAPVQPPKKSGFGLVTVTSPGSFAGMVAPQKPAAVRTGERTSHAGRPSSGGGRKPLVPVPSPHAGPAPALQPRTPRVGIPRGVGAGSALVSTQTVGTSRQPAGPRPASPALTASQIQASKAWYAARKDQYTPAVLRDIQKKLGLPVTGKVDTATLQGVARWQTAHRPLPIAGQQDKFPVNGRADATLLNHLFPSGLNRPDILKTYTRNFKVLAEKWPTLTPDQRQNQLYLLVSGALKTAQVPAVSLGTEIFEDRTNAEFTPEYWRINVSRALLNSKTLSTQDAAALADTLLHESEHTLQFFNMAQLEAGRKKDPSRTMRLDLSISKQAADAPIRPGTIAAIKADAYYQGIYGRDSAESAQITGDLSNLGKQLRTTSGEIEVYKRKLADLDKKIQNSNDAREKNSYLLARSQMKMEYEDTLAILGNIERDYMSIWNQYSRLPVEADAWRVGGEAGRNYTKK